MCSRILAKTLAIVQLQLDSNSSRYMRSFRGFESRSLLRRGNFASRQVLSFLYPLPSGTRLQSLNIVQGSGIEQKCSELMVNSRDSKNPLARRANDMDSNSVLYHVLVDGYITRGRSFFSFIHCTLSCICFGSPWG